MPASAQTEPKPQYGGTLEIGTVYVTLSALSFDPADWNWKLNHDTGNYLEQLFAADLTKSKKNGGKHPFYADAYLPSDAIRGELAESWEWKQDPLRVEVQPAQGHHVPGQAGRDGVARTDRRRRRVQLQPPRQESEGPDSAISPMSTRWKPPTSYTVVFNFKLVPRRMGLSLRLGLLLRQSIRRKMADAGATNWKNGNGTGPFMLDRLRAGQLQHLCRGTRSTGATRRSAASSTKLPLRRQGGLSHHQG